MKKGVFDTEIDKTANRRRKARTINLKDNVFFMTVKCVLPGAYDPAPGLAYWKKLLCPLSGEGWKLLTNAEGARR